MSHEQSKIDALITRAGGGATDHVILIPFPEWSMPTFDVPDGFIGQKDGFWIARSGEVTLAFTCVLGPTDDQVRAAVTEALARAVAATTSPSSPAEEPATDHPEERN